MDNFFNFRTDKKISIKIEEPEVDMIILGLLGKPKFWVSSSSFEEVMGKIYKTASKKARDSYFEQNQHDL